MDGENTLLAELTHFKRSNKDEASLQWQTYQSSTLCLTQSRSTKL